MAKKAAALLGLLVAVGLGATSLSASLDSLYQFYGAQDLSGSQALLDRMAATFTKPADKFVVELERGDFLLDKQHDYPAAEAVYKGVADANPKHKLLPDVLYRLALAQEMQEKYLDAARNYEKVATRYSKTTYGADALDAIERCFRKNYQERVAFVDGFPITRIEIDDRISRNPAGFDTYDKKQQLLDTMIDNRLLYSAALAADVQSDPAFVQSMTDARNRAMFSEWYERTVTKKATPTDAEVAAAYRKELATRYTTPEKVHGWQIQVATKAVADSLRRLLTTDTTLVWDSIAKQNSVAPDKERGGDMGLFARGVQSKEIEGAAFKLKVGTISQPIAIKDGFVLLKVSEKTPKTVRKLDDVKSSISADLRQQNTARLYEIVVADMKKQASVIQDSTALESGKETLAIVNDAVITPAMLQQRVEAIPPMFRAQFDSPEGKRRILDQIILEKLLGKEAERQKLWLVNKVADQLITRRNTLITDTYRKMMTTDKVNFDSVALYGEYQKTIADFNEPAKVHVREIAAPTQARADQVRRWAAAGKLPPMVQGRALLVPDGDGSAAAVQTFGTATNVDSLVNLSPLVPTPAQLPRLTTVQSAGKSLPDIGAKMKLAGPYQPGLKEFGLAFADFTKEDRMYKPELINVTSTEQLYQLLGTTPDAAALADTSRLGTYVQLTQPLGADLTTSLFAAADPAPIKLPSGTLLIKVTKRDTAQKAAFADIARKFSTSTTRWSGGDLYWLANDDKAHDARMVKDAFGLSNGAISPVAKLNDSTWAFVTVEEKKDAYTRPFGEVRSKIENKLRRTQETIVYDDLIKALRAGAKIEVTMKESDFVVEPPAEEQPAGQTAPTPPEK